MAAATLSESDAKQLRAIIRRGQAALDRQNHAAIENLDLEFHEALVVASKNPYLAKITRGNHEMIQVIRKATVGFKQLGEQSHMEHTAIVEAVLKGDGLQAEALLRDHIVRTEREALDALRA